MRGRKIVTDARMGRGTDARKRGGQGVLGGKANSSKNANARTGSGERLTHT